MDTERPSFRRAATTQDGPRIRLGARSYTAPQFSVEEEYDDPHSSYATPQAVPRRRQLLRAAFSLISAAHDHQQQKEHRRRQAYEEQSSTPDARRRSRVPSSNLNSSERQSRRQAGRSNERSPSTRRDRRSSHDRRGDAAGMPSTASYNNAESARPTQPRRTHIKMLESDVRYEEDMVAKYSQRLADYAGGDENSDRIAHRTMSKLQYHKQNLEKAKRMLSAALQDAETQEERHRYRSSRRRTTQSTGEWAQPDIDDLFENLFAGSQSRGARDVPRFMQSPLFDQVFADISARGFQSGFHTSRDFQGGSRRWEHHFFDVHSFFEANFNQGSFRSTGTQSTPGFTQARPPQQLLSAQEAKALYEAYNDRWTALASSDSAVPFPGRNLRSAALLAKETIWAPAVPSPVASWSNDAVIRGNVQSFFLAVADFSPIYTDRLGKINVEFDQSKASPAQLQVLVDMLKKEKLRWHSDKLGRRNDGQPGVNEALQQDEVARGIFHAICELSDLVTAKR